jgi:hypothetical protein
VRVDVQGDADLRMSPQTASANWSQRHCSRVVGTNRSSPQASLPQRVMTGRRAARFRDISVVTKALVKLRMLFSAILPLGKVTPKPDTSLGRFAS